MTLVQLEYFVTVCRLGSLVRAAEAVHVSQPAVSLALKELERECGFALFYREKKALKLTREGAALLEEAGPLLNRYRQLERQVQEIAGAQSQLRLGIAPMSTSTFFPALCAAFTARHPEVRVALTEGRTAELQQMLDQGSLDLIVVSLAPETLERYDTVPVRSQQACFCIRRDHPLAALEEVTPADMASVPLVLYPENFFLSGRVERMFQQQGLTPDIRYRSSQLSTIQSFIREGLAAGFLAWDLARQHPDVKAFPVTRYLHVVDTGLVWVKGRKLYSPAEKFIRFCKEYREQEVQP